jgi:hypothetical protein
VSIHLLKLDLKFNKLNQNRIIETDQSWACPTCNKVLDTSSTRHSCSIWSCSFLASPRSATDRGKMWSDCRYCLQSWSWRGYEERPPDSLEEEVGHLVARHGYRSCEQDRFASAEAFYKHLVDDHQAIRYALPLQDCRPKRLQRLMDACRKVSNGPAVELRRPPLELLVDGSKPALNAHISPA